MQFRLIALDVDDTLLNDSGHISERNKRAIRKAVEQGCVVTLATGRMHRACLDYMAELKMSVPVITCGGAEVNDGATGDIMYSCYLGDALMREIFAFAMDRGLYIQAYRGENFYYMQKSNYLDLYEGFSGFPGIYEPDILNTWQDMSSPKALGISEPDIIARYLAEARAHFGDRVRVSVSKPFYIEFNNPDASKGVALKFLAEHYGIKSEEVIAIGDAIIDIPMMQYAGMGVAVANATPDVLDIADAVTASNEEDGVARIIEDYVLK